MNTVQKQTKRIKEDSVERSKSKGKIFRCKKISKNQLIKKQNKNIKVENVKNIIENFIKEKRNKSSFTSLKLIPSGKKIYVNKPKRGFMIRKKRSLNSAKKFYKKSKDLNKQEQPYKRSKSRVEEKPYKIYEENPFEDLVKKK